MTVQPTDDSFQVDDTLTSKTQEFLALDTRWWQSVRVRFGVLLALALFPWLLVTALDARDVFDRSRLSQSELADVIAANLVREIGRTLEAGRLGLDAASKVIADRGCAAGSDEVLARLDDYETLIVEDADGTASCLNPPTLAPLSLVRPDPLDEARPFRIERGRVGTSSESDHVVVLQLRDWTSGQTYTLVLPEDFGRRDLLESALGNDAVVALTKPDGTGILGMDTDPEENAAYRARIPADQEALFDVLDRNGDPRRVASRFFDDLGIYVTVGRSARLDGIASVINPYTALLLPVLAWLVGFGLIWAGTQSMLLTPIRKVRRTARQFANGRFGSRVQLSGSAAAEVHGLANSFNRMAIQIEERESRIEDNLDEKDTLMREIHHRVKNNLQIIISLLNMQERKAESEDAITAISETRTRINAIAIVHRGLYESPDLRRIESEPFVARLVSAMGESLGLKERDIALSHAVEACHLSADNAIPIALFIVEAISNAAQHGVERGGSIRVEIEQPEPGRLRIEVRDDGRGVGDAASMRGIGTKLMKGFARQLSGTLDFADNNPGLTARLSLPIDTIPEQPFQVSRKKARASSD